jgi:hypothetical protein
MKSRHEPVAIIVPYSVALDLLGGMQAAHELFRDVGMDCTCPSRTKEQPCLEHQHDLAQAQIFEIAQRYVRAAMLAAERVHTLRHRMAP